MAHNQEVQDTVYICTECVSEQSFNYIVKNPFFQAGHRLNCQFCNGICIETANDGTAKEAVNKYNQGRRGFGSTVHPE